jgi:hypothetical protein
VHGISSASAVECEFLKTTKRKKNIKIPIELHYNNLICVFNFLSYCDIIIKPTHSKFEYNF